MLNFVVFIFHQSRFRTGGVPTRHSQDIRRSHAGSRHLSVDDPKVGGCELFRMLNATGREYDLTSIISSRINPVLRIGGGRRFGTGKRWEAYQRQAVHRALFSWALFFLISIPDLILLEFGCHMCDLLSCCRRCVAASSAAIICVGVPCASTALKSESHLGLGC